MRKSTMPKVRAIRSALALMMLAGGLCACAAPIAINRAALPCSGLIPPQLSDDVPGADIPSGNSAGDWIAFGDAQTGQLDKANTYKSGAIAIVKACEARDAQVDAMLHRKKFLGLF